jgi:hypothetical protein
MRPTISAERAHQTTIAASTATIVAMPFGQLSPRKFESGACWLTNVAGDKYDWFL